MSSRFPKTVIIDAREFVPGRFTGIGRVLTGLVGALAESRLVDGITMAVTNRADVPLQLKSIKQITCRTVPVSFLNSEKTLSGLTRLDAGIFISPYPKLPLFGVHCPSINIVHDVLDLTHSAYQKRIRVLFDRFRLKTALKKAALTWYDSAASMVETEKLIGYTGNYPKVRHLGIENRFNTGADDVTHILAKYNLNSGYIVVVGNGLPHKNINILLDISTELSRQFVFVGVPEQNKKYWTDRYPQTRALWIPYVSDVDLPALIRSAFCLAQPSTAEGYGLPPLEAMACGIPAVVSNIPVLLETTGSNAFTVNPHDAMAWLDAFESLENKNIYLSQVEKGLRWV